METTGAHDALIGVLGLLTNDSKYYAPTTIILMAVRTWKPQVHNALISTNTACLSDLITPV